MALALQNVFFSRQGLVLDRCLPLTTPFEFRLQLLTDILKAEEGRPADRHRCVLSAVLHLAACLRSSLSPTSACC